MTFKIMRGCRVVVHGRLTGQEILDALLAAAEQARAALEDEQQDWGSEEQGSEEQEEEGTGESEP